MTWEAPHQKLLVLRDEVLRWNKRFSLISRRNPEQRSVELIEECWSSFHALLPILHRIAAGLPINYFDLGSGGGFPGLVWAVALRENNPPLVIRGIHLVEPRQKRAWFLERTARAMIVPGVIVHEKRWGEPSGTGDDYDQGERSLALVSLKAVALTDHNILQGLGDATNGAMGSVLIVRFIGGHEAADPENLELPPHALGPIVEAGAPAWSSCPYRYGGRKDNLILSYYPAST